MKKLLELFVFSILLFAAIGLKAEAATCSGMPDSFWGYVTIDGSVAPVGTEVSAWIDGVKTSYTIDTTLGGLYGTPSGTAGVDPFLYVGAPEYDLKQIIFEVKENGVLTYDVCSSTPTYVQYLCGAEEHIKFRVDLTCYTSQTCGNGIKEGSEVCDSNSQSCTTASGYSGSQLCNAQCSGWNTCTSTQYCGDGIKNGPEVCDDGAHNGQSNYCNSLCTGQTNSVCGNKILEIGEQCEKNQDGSWPACCDSSICQFKPASTICRVATGACDVAETCTGSSAACPADTKAPQGTACDDSSYCNGYETCDGTGNCNSGTTIDCTVHNVNVNTCTYTPDDNPFTLDQYSFTSVCDEVLDQCTLPPASWQDSIIHSCDIGCGAQCITNADCGTINCDSLNGCYSGQLRVYTPAPNTCTSCQCQEATCTVYTVSGSCACTPSATQPCGTSNIGVCKLGTQTCQASGQWGDCVGAVYPTNELCNGLDDDCDGIVDNGNVCTPPDAHNVTVQIYAGWTLFALPYKPISVATSEQLGQAIIAQSTSCDIIMRYDGNTQMMQDDILGLADPTFVLSGGEGYFIHCSGALSFKYVGTPW